ncbi:MAG TPA: asparaginase [Thermoleophilia bacterium]|nr:asparaginase [Thermoleophilia bacterium]
MPKLVQHPEIIVQARRGGTVESVHRACAALAGPDGEIVERWGDPGMVTFWRSSAKPLQAQAWLADGTVDHYGWGAEELAIMSASHEGLDFQADLVRRMLADIGLSEDDLRCDAGLKARHNCSGNHTGFLAACAHHGWDVASYQQPGHPAQQAAFATFAAVTALEQTTIPTGVDGCGIVCYATPVTVAAATFALLPELLPEISAAMRAHPELVEAPGWIDTEVMRAIPGATSKCGAEGLCCISLPDGRGLAVKVVDGADRALEPAGLAALEAVLGPDVMTDALRALARPPIQNDAGDVVGELLAVIPG